MPIYEYRCGACGVQKEFLQRITEPPLTDCPDCGKPALTKLVSAAGFQLKGTGWYVTDFRDKPKPGKSGQSDGAKDSGSGSGEKSGSAASSSGSTSASSTTAKV